MHDPEESVHSEKTPRSKYKHVLTKFVGAVFRHKSRRLACLFWKWKFSERRPDTASKNGQTSLFSFHLTPQLPLHSEGKEEAHRANEWQGISSLEDPEVKALMDKYKLFEQVKRFNVELTEVDENCDAEDEEETISDKKKS